MALTLTANISATDRIIGVTGTVPADVVPGYMFRLDDEMLTFQTFDAGHLGARNAVNRQRWHVRRSEGGTVATPHTAGVTVYAARDANVASTDTTPPNSFASGDGGGTPQMVTLLGPITISFDDAGIDDQGVVMAELTPGDVVIAAWLSSTQTWIADGVSTGHQGVINRGSGSGPNVVDYANFGDDPVLGQEGPGDTPILHTIVVATEAHHTLVVSVYPASSTFTAGELVAYALVATPV